MPALVPHQQVFTVLIEPIGWQRHAPGCTSTRLSKTTTGSLWMRWMSASPVTKSVQPTLRAVAACKASGVDNPVCARWLKRLHQPRSRIRKATARLACSTPATVRVAIGPVRDAAVSFADLRAPRRLRPPPRLAL